MNDLDQLYQQVILDHSRERHGAGALDAPDGQSHQVNPTCGDEVTLDVKVQDGTIAAVGWQGRAALSPRPRSRSCTTWSTVRT